MFKNRLFTLAICTTAVFASAAIASDNHPAGTSGVIISFTRAPGAAEQALVRQLGGTVKYTYHLVPAIAAALPDNAVMALRARPDVLRVEPDGIVYAHDAELDNSWGVKHIGAGNVHATNKGTGIKLAIIDSGIDRFHPDLQANYHGGYDFVNSDADPMDDNGHGTHCAGIAAAADNNAGVVGVAPEAYLYALKVLNASGSGAWSDIIEALQWTVDNGIQVASMSLGASSAPTEVENACNAAYAAGVLLVASAGNSGKVTGRGDNINYPARYASVIAVGATDASDKRASWSSTGPDLELAAPGVNVYSTYPNASYATMSGTSMAAPHVTGTAALVYTAFPGWTNVQVRDQLNATADDLGDPGRDPLYGYGLVDADGAVLPLPPPVVMYVQSIQFGSKVQGKALALLTTVTVIDETGAPVPGVAVAMNEVWTDGVSTATKSFSGSTGTDGTVVFTWTKAKVGNYTATVTGLTRSGYTWNPSLGITTASCYLNADGSIVLGAGPGSVRAPSAVAIDHITVTRGGALIRFHATGSAPVVLGIYDAQGRLVRTMTAGSGERAVYWNGADESGAPVNTGLYFCRLFAGAASATAKMVYAK